MSREEYYCPVTFSTDWVCFDCELMPWSEKAKELLKTRYAAVGASATAALSESVKLLKKTANNRKLSLRKPKKGESSVDTDIHFLSDRYKNRQKAIKQYIEAYRQYCWPVYLETGCLHYQNFK